MMFKSHFEFLDFAMRMAAANPNGFRMGKTSKKRKFARGRAAFDRPTFIEALAAHTYGD